MEFEKIEQLIHTVSESNLTSFRYEENGVKICLKKENGRTQYAGGGLPMQGAALAQSGVQTAGLQNAGGAGALQADNGAAAQVQAQVKMPADAAAGAKIVKSPLVGVFYTAPAEDAEPYVSVGDTVKKGQVLATVEAMKLMNEIESEYDGVVEEILAENGQGVGYGEPLFVIR